MRFSRHQLLALILGAGMATALPAQGGRGGRGRQLDTARVGRMMDSVRARRVERGLDTARLAEVRERIAAGSSPAGLILSMRDRLQLTDDQVNRLETLKSAYAEPKQDELNKLREDLANASKGEANLPAARAALNKMAEFNTNAAIARLDARNKARAVLNGDQQATYDSIEARRPGLAGGALVGAGVSRGGGGRGGQPPAPGAPARRGRGGSGGAGGTIPPSQR